MNTGPIYSREFLDEQVGGSSGSAGVIVPLLLSLLPVRSVIDIGCGLGAWAAEFLAHGVPDVWGVDGDYVERSRLRIPSDRFWARDLKQPIQLHRTFDLALCLEVAEHLPESRAASLVVDLTALAPSLLFSAAVPGQGGNNHLNEQYLPYWVDLFQKQGFEAIDPIRPRILGNDSVVWWYQQNTVMFVSQRSPLSARDFPKPRTFIHQELYDRIRRPTLGMLVRAFPGTMLSSIRYRLGRR